MGHKCLSGCLSWCSPDVLSLCNGPQIHQALVPPQSCVSLVRLTAAACICQCVLFVGADLISHCPCQRKSGTVWMEVIFPLCNDSQIHHALVPLQFHALFVGWAAPCVTPQCSVNQPSHFAACKLSEKVAKCGNQVEGALFPVTNTCGGPCGAPLGFFGTSTGTSNWRFGNLCSTFGD